MAKLAALVPRPYENLFLYHSVLAACSKLHASVVSYGRDALDSDASHELSESASPPQSGHQRRLWAELMRRAFGYEMFTCPKYDGKKAFLGCIFQRSVIDKILARAGPAAET